MLDTACRNATVYAMQFTHRVLLHVCLTRSAPVQSPQPHTQTQSIPLKDWCRYEQAFSVPNEAIDLAMYKLQFTSDSIYHFITALSVQPSDDNNR